MGKELSILMLGLVLAAVLATSRHVQATLGEPADSAATYRKALSR